MRCKKHFTDLTSVVGVCASCLRERLLALIEAQAQAQIQIQIQAQSKEDHRKSDASQAQIVFPRSVSPYISRRKSDNAVDGGDVGRHLQHSLSEQRFYSTPQIGPNGVIITTSLYRRKDGKFSILSKLFRSKTQKYDLDQSLDSKSRESYSTTATTSSPSWFSSIFASKQKKKARTSTISDPSVGRSIHRPGRGMSPMVESDDECDDRSSGNSSGSPQGWKETPRRSAKPSQRGGRRPNHSRNVSGLAFCLSPLVRPSPNRHWNQKGMPPEIAITGELRSPAKPHLGVAASFHANRSRKLANFGRFNPAY